MAAIQKKKMFADKNKYLQDFGKCWNNRIKSEEGKNEKFKEPLDRRVQIASTFGFLSYALTSVGSAASLEASPDSWSPTPMALLPSCRLALPGTAQPARASRKKA